MNRSSKKSQAVDASDRALPFTPQPGTPRAAPLRTMPASLPGDLHATHSGVVVQPALLFAPPHLRAPEPAGVTALNGTGGSETGVSSAIAMRSSPIRTSDAENESDENEQERGGNWNAATLEFLEHARDMLSNGGSSNALPLLQGRANNATYDFDEYLFLRTPGDPYALGGEIVAEGPHYQRLVQQVEAGISSFVDYARLPLPNTGVIATRAASLQQTLASWWAFASGSDTYLRLRQYDRLEVQDTFGMPAEEYYGESLGWWLKSTAVNEARTYLSTGYSYDLGPLVTRTFWEDALESTLNAYFHDKGVLRKPQPTGIPSDAELERFKAAAGEGIEMFLQQIRLSLPNPTAAGTGGLQLQLRNRLTEWWAKVCSVRSYNTLGRYSGSAIRRIHKLPPEQYYGLALCDWLIANAHRECREFFTANGDPAALGRIDTVAFWEDAVTGVFAQSFVRIPFGGALGVEDDYPFEPFPSNEVLFGLRVVHRQTWRLLGYAPGDLVKTIPLGPRETQKVSVKVTSRTKRNSTKEQASSYETSSESTNTTKDSSEVVLEATESLNRNAQAEVSGGYGPFIQAKVSAGISQDIGSSSRDTKSRLNEVMEKTASRMKRDTKVTVTTEKEDGFEIERSSELTNPNEEIAITYLYSRLQQRYWVSTETAEVHSVVYVPEPLPAWHDIDESWVRRHADVLSRALLDAELASVLATIRKEPEQLQYSSTSVFNDAATAAIKAASDYKAFTGGAMPDLLASGQHYFERDFERRNTLLLEQERRRHQSEALLSHIRRNILHYMRAIWSSEDYDQRMQRYSRMRVPTTWYFVPASPLPPLPNSASPLEVDGVFMADPDSARALTDLIDPIGPIGYLFNCAIYRLRDSARVVNLHQALSYLRAAYLGFTVTPETQAQNLTIRQATAHSPRTFSADYTFTYRSAGDRWLLVLPGRPEQDWPGIDRLADGSLDAVGIRLWFDGAPSDLDSIVVRLRSTSELEDPQLRLVRLMFPLPSRADEESVFTTAILREMAGVIPSVGIDAHEPQWANLTGAQQEAVRANYHRFLMLRESGRVVTIDTANVMLDLEVSASAALEPFKRLHRYIDVLKEHEEMRRRTLENHRRAELLRQGRLGDPEIEHVTILSKPEHVNDIIVAPPIPGPVAPTAPET